MTGASSRIRREAIDVDLVVLRRLDFDVASVRHVFGDLLEHLGSCSRRRDARPRARPLTAFSVAIIGTTSSCTRRFTSSTASTFVGSAIATKSLPFRRAIGTSLFAFAISRGTSDMISSGHAQFRQIDRRRIQATPHAERHVLVGDELLVRQNLEQPAAFLLLDADRFLELVRQEQTVLDQDIGDAFGERFASHRRRERLGPALQPVDVLQSFDDRARPRQVPRHGVIERLLHRLAACRVERIAARHHDRAADQVERHDTVGRASDGPATSARSADRRRNTRAARRRISSGRSTARAH